MKKIFFILMIALIAVGCNEKNEPENPDSKTDPKQEETSTDKVTFLNAVYYGEEGSAHRNIFYFATGNVAISSAGQTSGTGRFIVLTTYAASVDANFYPVAGTYNVASTAAAGTVLAGYDAMAQYGYPGMQYDGSYYQEVTNGTAGSVILITSGNVAISGTTTAAKFELNLKDEKNNELKYSFSGALPITDARQ